MSFNDVVGQDHVTKTLQAAIKSGRISHAYLFTGPRGVGKTSIARILAHEVNQLPYNGESIHLDIIEIDAASNRRIDEIRELRERVRIAPASAKYKVYIIDEVHMLTREAFNALLKTLEEPPAHCIFILATTEAHKLPETIISRTQRFEFKPIGPSDAVKHLSAIAKREKIAIEPDALDLLAAFGRGSFRDSISYLDQLSTRSGKVTAKEVRDILGLPSKSEIEKLLHSIQSGDLAQVMGSLQSVRSQGVDAAQAAAALGSEIRRLAAQGSAKAALIGLLKQLIEVPASARPYDFLEIIILEAAQAGRPDGEKSDAACSRTEDKADAKPKKPADDSSKRAGTESAIKLDASRWGEVTERAKDKAASIYTALTLAKPSFENGRLTLVFEFPLHQKKLNLAANKQLVASIVKEIYGLKVKVECVVDKDAFRQMPDEALASAIEDPAHLASINNIFGGAEVLES